MKRIFKYIAIFATLAMGFAATGCLNDKQLVESIDLVRCLSPLNLSVKIIDGNQVTFRWDAVKGADRYTLEVYTSKTMDENSMLDPVEVESDELPVTITLDPDSEYWFRVRAFDSTGKLDPSKWSVYEKSVKTYAVRPTVYPAVADRTSNSITISWDADAAASEVDSVKWCVLGSEDQLSRTLTEAEVSAAAATVTGLEPFTNYVVSIYFKSANRGDISVWTRPDTDGYTAVSTAAALTQAVKDGGKFLLKMEGSPYVVGITDISNGFEIVGEESTNGGQPVIQGEFHVLKTVADGASFIFKSVELNGNKEEFGFPWQLKNPDSGKGQSFDKIQFVNCTITGYSKGLCYEWGGNYKANELTWDGCTIYEVNKNTTQGGDGIDFRGTSDIQALNVVNNTIYNGFRTFFRIDANTILGAVKINNNTMMNFSKDDASTNNNGILGVKAKPGSFEFQNNLILYMDGNAKLNGPAATNLNTSDLGINFSSNYFYGITASAFFNEKTSQAEAVSGGGKILEVDPCYKAKAGIFNISDSDIINAKVGAPKWLMAYNKKPEDLTMTVIEGTHNWDFTNPINFLGSIDEKMVRDQLFLGVIDNKLNVSDEGIMQFLVPTTVNRSKLPLDGYLAFLVDKPGSVYVKPVNINDQYGNHIVVGMGDVEGKTISIKGGAAANTDNDSPTKIVIRDITEPSLIYVYATGQIGLEKLGWAYDTTPVNTALAAPSPVANPKSITAGEAEDIVLTWEPVANAASYSVAFNGKTYDADNVAEGETPRYTISSTTVKMLDAGSYTANVYANPSSEDIYHTMSAAGTAAFAILPAGGSSEEGASYPVKNLDEFMSALEAQKASIQLLESGSPYKLATPLTITYPVEISGEHPSVTIEGGVTFAEGEIAGDVIFRNLTFDDSEAGHGNFITFADKMTMGNLTVENVNLKGFNKSAIYGNYEETFTGDIIFRNATITEWGVGQGVFDFRKGSYCCVKILESTIVGGRDLIRMDSTCSCGDIVIRNNTIDGSNTSANGNGVLYVRAKTSSYIVSGNLFLNEVAEGKKVIFSKASGVIVPDMRRNFYYNIDETNFFSGVITEEIATDGNGVVLQSDPVKNSAEGDYTLVSGLAMSCKVGDPRWNPSQVQEGGDSFTVTSAEEYEAAISAGKTNITFKAGEYALSINARKDLRLTGEGDVTIVGSVDIAGDDLGNLVFDNIYFKYNGTNGNGINVSAASVANSVIVRNCSFDGFPKSVWYDNEGLATSSLVLSNNIVVNHGTSQGVFDIRKGNYTTVTLEQNTIVGGRDLIRADAGTITGAFTFRNNTVDGSNLAVNTNGIMYVRATPAAYIMNNNLFINEVKEGAKVILAKATGVTLPTAASTNFFYNIDQENFFSGIFNKEVAAAVEVTNCPVKDAANGDYTLVDALAMASNVGPRRWNPRSGSVTTDFTVNNTEEFLNAIAVGKSGITMNYGVYDLTAVEANESLSSGVLTLTSPIAIKGVEKSGKKPQIIGGIKLGAGVDNFTLQNVVLDGNSQALGNAIEVDGELNSANIIVRACDFKDYSKSAYYHSTTFAGSVNLFSINACTVRGFGTGQGVFDIRTGTYTTVIIENSTIYNGGRDFLRADAGLVTNSLAVKNNTFASTGVGAGNGLLWVRSTPNNYVVANNLFINEVSDGTKTLLAKTGATKATMANNHFFNCDSANFWSGAYTQEDGTANGGSVLDADPCNNTAEFDFTLTNNTLKDAKVGDPRWR
ncbi:MAG: DUF5123 domain-containing protein [Candidatus Cryptobacteroides sp.]